MKIEKKRGWILIEFDKEERKNFPMQIDSYRIKFVKFNKLPTCQRTDWTESGVWTSIENWEWAKWFTNDLKQLMEGKNV